MDETVLFVSDYDFEQPDADQEEGALVYPGTTSWVATSDSIVAKVSLPTYSTNFNLEFRTGVARLGPSNDVDYRLTIDAQAMQEDICALFVEYTSIQFGFGEGVAQYAKAAAEPVGDGDCENGEHYSRLHVGWGDALFSPEAAAISDVALLAEAEGLRIEFINGEGHFLTLQIEVDERLRAMAAEVVETWLAEPDIAGDAVLYSLPGISFAARSWSEGPSQSNGTVTWGLSGSTVFPVVTAEIAFPDPELNLTLRISEFTMAGRRAFLLFDFAAGSDIADEADVEKLRIALKLNELDQGITPTLAGRPHAVTNWLMAEANPVTLRWLLRAEWIDVFLDVPEGSSIVAVRVGEEGRAVIEEALRTWRLVQ